MARLKTARRILITNSVAIAALLVIQLIYMYLADTIQPETYIYTAIITTMLCCTIGSIFLLKRSVTFGINLCAWLGMICVIGMVTVDALVLPDSFPVVLFVLHLGIWSLGVTIGLTALIPYTIASSVIFFISGLVYNSVDSALVAIFLAIVAASPALEVRRLSKELKQICEAVRVWTNERNNNSNPRIS